MDITKLQNIIISSLDDGKAQDIKVFDTLHLTGLFERIVIATATSNRQTRSLASHVRDEAKSQGADVIATEGEEAGEWILVDFGDIVVHIMQAPIRQYYNLEELWGDKPIALPELSKKSGPHLGPLD